MSDSVSADDVKHGWEIFCDASYFDMWCVRPVDEKRWGAGIHVVNRDGAEAARDYLIEKQRQTSEALAELRLWRSLVNEGGVPRYTVTPGAALNTIVTSTDALLRKHREQQTWIK